MSINKRQNSELNLKRLAAQRQLYTDAKKIMLSQYFLSGVVTVILALIGNLVQKEYVVYTVFGAIIIAFLDEIFLSQKIDDIKQIAARIQEDFDCDVLQTHQNCIKYENISTKELVQEKSQVYLLKNHNYEILKNWYPGMDGADNRYGKILCQSTNCWWNQALRKKYVEFLNISLFLVFIILLSIAIIKGITLSGFIMSVFSPILPSFVLVYKINRDNKKAISNLNHMKNKLDEIIQKIQSGNYYTDEQLATDTRCLQDMIYENRALSPLIPDKFYFKYRNKYEEVAQATNRDLVDTIKNAIGSSF